MKCCTLSNPMVYRRTKINTSELIAANAKFVKTLATARSKERRKHLIRNASTGQILALVEIALNLLRGRVPIRSNQRQRLGTHAPTIRRLARVRSDKAARKVLLRSEQQGSGPFAVASIISRLLVPFLLDAL